MTNLGRNPGNSIILIRFLPTVLLQLLKSIEGVKSPYEVLRHLMKG
jgi:hypothetical protein